MLVLNWKWGQKLGKLAVIDQVLAVWNQSITTEVVVWRPELVATEVVSQFCFCISTGSCLCISILSLRILCRQSCGLQIEFYVFFSNLRDFGLFSSLIVLARTSVQCWIGVVRADIVVFVPDLENLRSFLVECDISCRFFCR